MLFKATIAPLCRCCFKPIGKATDYHYFGQMASGDSRRFGSTYPRSKAEVQDLINGVIVSVSWRRYDPHNPHHDTYRRETGGDYIDKVTVWDGESYKDELFCTDRCAVSYARTYAEAGYKLTGYDEALETHIAKSRK
ncbi:hypothetical protein HOU02_gp430 [Caulobacter phage CcrBL9]|uniref:Uncharacterized protein n=1 Tax=Caulobacter phage CcrBL9 TaxID=2283270 RepID=A0A385EE53_9CAUD|nr:hypothetical protein HOU02_gp430 [Caulobacter phage CcrBL9]AXQ69295.1 hypothetical protein CcrBL9_gp271c [Caulobacter phage CcrBL9]